MTRIDLGSTAHQPDVVVLFLTQIYAMPLIATKQQMTQHQCLTDDSIPCDVRTMTSLRVEAVCYVSEVLKKSNFRSTANHTFKTWTAMLVLRYPK